MNISIVQQYMSGFFTCDFNISSRYDGSLTNKELLVDHCLFESLCDGGDGATDGSGSAIDYQKFSATYLGSNFSCSVIGCSFYNSAATRNGGAIRRGGTGDWGEGCSISRCCFVECSVIDGDDDEPNVGVVMYVSFVSLAMDDVAMLGCGWGGKQPSETDYHVTAGVNAGTGNSVNMSKARGSVGAFCEMYTNGNSFAINYNQLDSFSYVTVYEAWLVAYGFV